MRMLLFVNVWLAAQLALSLALAAEPEYYVVLETGGHRGLITDIAFAPDGKRLYSSSDDKTVRIWDLETGKTVRIIRGQIGRGQVGRIRAMALSPDGRWLAAAGELPNQSPETGFHIRLYDLEAEEPQSPILFTDPQGHKYVIDALAFSPDGQKLVSADEGQTGGTAIIWDVGKRELLTHLRGHTKRIAAVAFSRDNERAMTVSDDGTWRLWRVSDGQWLNMAQDQDHDGRVRTIAVAPDDTVATGDKKGTIRLWNGKTGEFLKSFARQEDKQDMEVGSLSFSPNGDYLLSTCGEGSCAGKPERVWERATGKQIATYPHHDNFVLASAISSNGRWAATGGGNLREIHVWELQNGKQKVVTTDPNMPPAPIVLAGPGQKFSAVGFSADGTLIGFGPHDPCPEKDVCPNDLSDLELRFRLPSAAIPGIGPPKEIMAEERDDYRRVEPVKGEWELSDRENEKTGYHAYLDVKRAGERLDWIERSETDGKQHMAYTFSPDGELIISGGNNGVLEQFDRDTRERRCKYDGHANVVTDLATSADGRFLASTSNDQTLKLWNLKTCEEIVSFASATNGEWVMWTPQGYYASSPNGDALVGWQINRGIDKPADFNTAKELRKHLFRPGVVEKAILLASAEKAIADSKVTDFQLKDLLERGRPKFEIIQPKQNARVNSPTIDLELDLGDDPDPVTEIEIFVNGHQVLKPDQLRDRLRGLSPERAQNTFTVPGIWLEKGKPNRIEIWAHNGVGVTERRVDIFSGAQPSEEKTLHLLAIGVDNYPNLPPICQGPDQSCELKYAVKDATAFFDKIIGSVGPMHTKIERRMLINGMGDDDAPTRGNINSAMDDLDSSLEEDTVIVFISGHGVNVDSNEGKLYYFLPTDAEPRDNGKWDSNSVFKWSDLADHLARIKGRKILFFDTCFAANFYNGGAVNSFYHHGISVFSAVDGNGPAQERSDLGHGAFTFAVLKGLEEADLEPGKNKRVETKELDLYVTKEVNRLTKGSQTPDNAVRKNYTLVELD